MGEIFDGTKKSMETFQGEKPGSKLQKIVWEMVRLVSKGWFVSRDSFVGSHLKMDGWNTRFLLGCPISGRVYMVILVLFVETPVLMLLD